MLQRGAGNRAVSGAIAQRAPGVPGVPYKTLADIDAMTVAELDAYATSRPDWSLDPTLPTVRKRSLVNALRFARSGDPAPVGAAGDMPVKDVEATGLTRQVRKQLRTYARGVRSEDTAGLEKTAVVADGLSGGDALGKLERKIPRGVLHHSMGKTQDGKNELANLMASSEIDNFANYVRRSRAFLEAEDGFDINSYLKMVDVDGKHPADYIGRPRLIRNYHRFLAPMLDTLAANERDRSKSKPLLVILHSGTDHNGAFHRDAELMNLIQHPRNLAIMIEGASTLEAAGAKVERVARRHGQRSKMQQLMIAGHGGPTSIEVAGSQDASGETTLDDADLTHNKRRTERFLRRLVRRVETGPDARIVLNACLTAADEVAATLPADPTLAAAAIRKSLVDSPSLATRLGQLAPGRTVEGNISSVPAGEYMGTDPVTGAGTGLLHQIIPSDPYATSTNRADYIEHGAEAEGAIRALIVVWATDKAEALRRVNLRRARAISGWNDRVIHTFYDIFNAESDNVSLLNKIANTVARGLSEFHVANEQKPGYVSGLGDTLTKAEAMKVVTPLYPHMTAGAKIAIEQTLMTRDAGRRPAFMTLLDGFATTASARPHLDGSWLAPVMAALLPIADAPTASRAQMKLALYGSTEAGDGDADAFLTANAAGTGTFTMPGGATVSSLTGGGYSESDVLRDLGLLAPTAVGSGSAPAPNYDVDGDGTADVHIRSITRESRIAARRLNVRQLPDTASSRVDGISRGRRIEVIGVSGEWYAIEYGGRVRFVHSKWVRHLAVR